MVIMTNVYYNKITFQQNNKSQAIHDFFLEYLTPRLSLKLPWKRTSLLSGAPNEEIVQNHLT